MVAVSTKPDISEARVNFNYQLFCHFPFNQFIYSGITDFWPFRITNTFFIKDLFLLLLCCIQWQHQDGRQLFTLLYYSPSNFLCLVNQNNLWELTRMPDQQDAEPDTEIHSFKQQNSFVVLQKSLWDHEVHGDVCTLCTQFPKHC